MKKNTDPIPLSHLPWGRAVGLIVGCAIILAGAIAGTGPAHIVIRATVAAALSATVVRGFVWLVDQSSVSRRSDGTPRST